MVTEGNKGGGVNDASIEATIDVIAGNNDVRCIFIFIPKINDYHESLVVVKLKPKKSIKHKSRKLDADLVEG